jgi:hypothetical protein
MRRPIAFGLALALGAVAAAALASCGGEDAQLLPGETAAEITANLDTVEQRAGEGDCAGAEEAAGQVSAQVEALAGVDPALERALRRGVARLSEVVAECEEAPEGAIAPARAPDASERATGAERRRKEAERDRAEREAEREAEGEEEEAEAAPPQDASPAPEGQGESAEGEEGPAESPSGGVSPGSAVEGEG